MERISDRESRSRLSYVAAWKYFCASSAPPRRRARLRSGVLMICFDDIRNLVYGLTPIEGVLVSEPVVNDVREYDTCAEGVGHPRKQGWVHDRRSMRIRGRRRWLPLLRRRQYEHVKWRQER